MHGHDFTADTNQINLTCDAAALDRTTFRHQGWTNLHGGLKTNTFAMSGFWQSADDDAVDPEAYADLGVSNRPFTIGPVEAEGSPAYLFRAGHFDYNLFGSVGELAPFTLTSNGTDGDGVVRGQLAAAMREVSAPGVLGSGLDLGAVAEGQTLYATVHVFAAATSITIDVESDDSAAFASPTTRATIGPLTARGGTWRTVAGPTTDTHWRFNVSDITGTFTVAAALGIK
ncbi:hypothetical protein E1295_31875 [Nonomuraea mesophila]|uniref:Uncharacterized protein n=1 Tax=Nonomuraea mesophila TaxID=2530382 RepID=A0A4R5F029_9ACTN|nr:hypothetical protein [Nonomuraea mesophila]TDE40500.1 hypothetical protein E1295_31875 [Nonomuraea mesophila]